MSIGRLGSYNEILSALHRLVQSMPAPVQSAPTPAPVGTPSPLGVDTYIPTSPSTPVAPPVSAPIAPPASSPVAAASVTPPAPIPPAPPAPTPPAAEDPNSFFMSQVKDARWNPKAVNGNTNCGPASLAMALRAIGLQPPGLTNPQNPEEWIDKARMAMEGDTNSFKLTSDDDVLRGALSSGAKAQKVSGVQGVEQAIAQGKVVAVAGNPTAYENRLSNSEYAHFNGGHFILVSAINGNQVTVEDPQSHMGSFNITLDELQKYMSYQDWNVGVAIWKG